MCSIALSRRKRGYDKPTENPPLYLAALRGDLDIINELLRSGAMLESAAR